MRIGAVGAILAACAALPPPSSSGTLQHERPSVEASPLERALLADARNHRLTAFSTLDAALIASGVRTEANLASARARFHEKIDPLLEEVRPLREPDARGRRLLDLLFDGARRTPVLGTYEVEATTLLDVLETGHFDCVSATMVYLIAAEASGLDGHPVFLPSHARAAITLTFGDVRVETTTPGGFDPDPRSLRAVVQRFNGGANAVAVFNDEAGTDGDFLGLLGVIYVNSAALASAHGDHELAARLTERAEAFFPADRLAILRMVRASHLNALAVQAFEAKQLDAAFSLLIEAAGIAPEGETRRLVEGNLIATADRRIATMEFKSSADEQKIFAVIDKLQPWPAVFREVKALALTTLAESRRQRGDLAGAAAAAKEAASLTADPTTRAVTTSNVFRAEVNRLGKLAESDPEAAWKEFQKLQAPPNDAATLAIQKEAAAYIASQRAAAAANDGKCELVEAAVHDWQANAAASEADHVRAICHEVRGIALLNGDKGYLAALGELREAYRLNPKEAVNRTNLVAALERAAVAAAKTGDCRKAIPYVREGLAVEPSDAPLSAVARRCGQ